jgi:hypothetical protein
LSACNFPSVPASPQFSLLCSPCPESTGWSRLHRLLGPVGWSSGRVCIAACRGQAKKAQARPWSRGARRARGHPHLGTQARTYTFPAQHHHHHHYMASVVEHTFPLSEGPLPPCTAQSGAECGERVLQGTRPALGE